MAKLSYKMIQRTQSFNLLIASVASLFYFFYTSTQVLSYIAAACGGLCLITLLLFKKRKLQLRITFLCIATALALLGFQVYFYIDSFMLHLLHFAFPIVVLINVLLAIGGINKDEALIKSVDRLR